MKPVLWEIIIARWATNEMNGTGRGGGWSGEGTSKGGKEGIKKEVD